ncbi:MFS general substrate transporter [Peniophora sp. CONT]|nr:MFS general substrate transporter [Peniophora sp. CONT]
MPHQPSMTPSPTAQTIINRSIGDKKDDISMVERAESEKHAGSDSDKVSVTDFGGDSTLPPPPVLTAAEEKALYHKVDMRLMPILTVMYLLSFLDRGNIGNAKIQGLTTQLDLTGNKYNIALTMYFIPYCLFECPSNLILKKFRPSRWLPFIMVVWGTVMTLMGLVKTYPQLVGVRVCLGVAEAGLFPGVVYYFTLWYPREMLQFRVGIFYGAASMAGAFSGLLAFAISFMDGIAGLEGWSWIFILEGIATVIVGVVAFFVVVDFPSTAAFLTPEERSYLVWRKKYDNSSVGEEERFAMRHLVAAFTDWQIYAHILVYMSIVGPLYGFSLFLPSIISTFGFTAAISNLLTVPPYIVATIVLIIFAILSDRMKKRSPFILICLALLVVGFGINISNAPSGVKYFGTFFCITGSYAAFPGIVAWLGNNLSGQYKRGIGMAVHIGIGNLSGAIASNVYRTQDAPRYIIGHGIMFMFVGIGLIATPLVVLNYIRINRNRDAIAAAGGIRRTDKELREMGDRAPDFRYIL